MTLEQKGRWLFSINAVINWSLSIRGLIDPSGMASIFGGAAPSHPFLVRLWSGLVFMFGIMFWETGRDPRGKVALIKYGEVPARLMALIVATNWIWIPVIIAYEIAQRRAIAGDLVQQAG